MRYVQLRAFHHVATCGGFSRAAEALSLSQPAVSDQVRKLEEEYDVLLFNREKRRVVPTSAGQRLLAVTQRLFEAERQAAELLAETRALRSGRLRVIADSAHHLLHVLGEFRQQHPRIEIVITSGNSEQVAAALHAYEAELGVLGEIPRASEFEIVPLGSSPLIAFVGREHPLAGRGRMRLAEIADAPLVLREPGSKTRRDFEAAAAERGLTVRAAIEAQGREAVRELVAAGSGVGIVSRAEFGRDDRLVPIEIEDCQIIMDEALICLRERASGKLIRTFLDLARSMRALESVTAAK
jgi:LysR family transcriptional regulator, low CO2-responsive transcriptional regulator